MIQGLDIKAELAKNTQFLKNVSNAQNWVGMYDTSLAELKDLVTTAKEVALSMSYDTYDAEARVTAAVEIRSLIDQMVKLSESQIQGKYVFSGYRGR